MKGIMFRPEMIEAIVNGTKTQTRRVIKPQPDLGLPDFEGYSHISVGWYHPTKIDKNGEQYPGSEIFGGYTEDGEWGWRCPYQVGETVYIKEAWQVDKMFDELSPSELPANLSLIYPYGGDPEDDIRTPSCYGRVRSPLHLRAKDARHFLTITGVRGERLQEIKGQDCLAEGVAPCKYKGYTESYKNNDYLVGHFATLWNSINKDYPWESNPWVFVYVFELLRNN